MKRLTITLALLCLVTSFAQAQWDSTTNTSYVTTQDKVGVGINAPLAKVHIVHSGTLGGKADASKSFLTISDGNNHMFFDVNEITGTNQMLIGAAGDIRFRKVISSGYDELMIVKNTGKVGIGTIDPYDKFHIQRDAVSGAHYLERAIVFESGESRFQILASDADNAASMIHLTNAPVGGGDNKHWGIHHTGASRNDRLEIGYGTSTTSGDANGWDIPAKLTIETDGDIGIGTTSPGSRLDVRGGDLMVYKNDIKLLDESNGTNDGMGIGFMDNAKMSIYADAEIHFKESDQMATKVWMDLNQGKMGVRTTTVPGDYAFAVDGKAIMEEVKVELSGSWPDYVFSPGYQLRSLEETKAYIDQNHHLPDMPSAKEVAEEGISLGEMNAKLLEKIEELTLHVIELSKQNEAQNREIEKLKAKIK